MINKEILMNFYYTDSYENDKKRAEDVRILFEKYLDNNPYDTEIWIKFALLAYCALFHDDVDAQAYLEKILAYDPHNIKVILFHTYIVEHYSYLNDALMERLNKLKTDDKSLMSLIEFQKSSYYYIVTENPNEYEKCLLRSIKFCDKYFWNNVHLGRFYLRKGFITKGHEYLKKGLNNLEYVYDDTRPRNILDLEEFFNERLKGIHLSQSNYNITLESFDPTSPWITGDFITKKNKNITEN